jgi:hypothetical protein
MIRKVNEQKARLLRIGNQHARQLRWTGWLLIVLAFSTVGCVRGDWVNETLTLVDITGTRERVFRLRSISSGVERATRWVLQQRGPKVKGEVLGPDGALVASIEGLVNGEVFSWVLTGPFIFMPGGSAPSQSYRGEAKVSGDELSGTADGQYCPCTFLLRRVGSDAEGKKAQ